jgi:hypothetical protein
MYIKDHNPPHFHAKYNEFQATFSIENFALLNGKLPSKALSLVLNGQHYIKQSYKKIGAN